MGRKPKTLEKHIIEGTLSCAEIASRYRDKGKVKQAIENPPKELNKRQKILYKQFGMLAFYIGVLTLADLEALKMLAITTEELEEEYKELNKEARYFVIPNGSTQTNPRLKTINTLTERKLKIMDKLYLVPEKRNEIANAGSEDKQNALKKALQNIAKTDQENIK